MGRRLQRHHPQGVLESRAGATSRVIGLSGAGDWRSNSRLKWAIPSWSCWTSELATRSPVASPLPTRRGPEQPRCALVGTGVAAGDDGAALAIAVRQVVAAGGPGRGGAVIDDSAQLSKDPSPAGPYCCQDSAHWRLLVGARTSPCLQHGTETRHLSGVLRHAAQCECSRPTRARLTAHAARC